MWHEARKQERKIRGIMVDYKRRAERRRDFYEKIKADPTQFLQLHGRPVKVHLDPAVALAGDSPANMMPWQGHTDILIDRFDVRAHLDYIPDYPQKTEPPAPEDLPREERIANYERYRIIVQNEFLGVPEEKFLHQLYLEEQFGPVVRPSETEKKKKPEKGSGAAIPFTYDEGSTASSTEPAAEEETTETDVLEEKLEDEEEDDDSDIDFDLCVDVTQIGPQQAHEMNVCGSAYGMNGNDFFTFLTNDIEEKETLRLAREQEEEKAMYSGRKSRRERRAYREKRLQGRKISPPSYAARTSPTYAPFRESLSKSHSRSPSPVNAGQITYITSFGGEEEERPVINSTSNKSLAGSSQTKIRRSRSPNNKPSSKYHSRSRNSNSPVRSHYWKDSSGSSRRGSYSKDRNSSSRRQRSRSPARFIDNHRHGKNRSPPHSDYSWSGRNKSPSSSEHSRRGRSKSPRQKKSRSPTIDHAKRGRSRSPRQRRSKSPSTDHSKKCRSRSPQTPVDHRIRLHQHRSCSADSSNSKSSPKPQSVNQTEEFTVNKLPPPPVRRYYGRGKSSSSELSESDSDANKEASPPRLSKPSTPTVNSGFGNSGGGNKLQQKFTPQERLKRKMQALLNKQYKADKRAERMRHEKQEQERQDREDELREMAIKLRRRERERRHRMQDDEEELEEFENVSSGSMSSDSSTRSPSPLPVSSASHKKNRWDDGERSGNRRRDHSNERQNPDHSKSSPVRSSKHKPLVDY